MNKLLIVSMALLGLSMAACGGGGSPSSPLPTVANQPQSVAVPLSANTATLPSGSASLTISVNAGPLTVVPVSGPTVNASVDAQVGMDTFVINDYDGPNGTGHLLATGTATQNIILNTANHLTVVLQPV
jgi:hypothetical protein